MTLRDFLPPALARAYAGFVGKAIGETNFAQAFMRGDDMDEVAMQNGRSIVSPYRRSAWVAQAINKIALPISSVELEFYECSGEEAEVEDPALAAFWRAPALNASGRRIHLPEVEKALVGWYKLEGEFFLLLDDTWVAPFARPASRAPFIIARPDRMRHVLNGSTIIGWEFMDARGRKEYFTPDQVIHRKRWNPYDDYRGLSEYDAARIATESDYLAGQFTRNLSAANGDQGPYVVAKQSITDTAQREQIEAALMEKSRRQKAGLPTPTFINGDVSIEDPQIRSLDANTLVSRLQSRQEVAVAFGLPPSSFEVKAAYSIGSASDEYQIIANVCMPVAAEIATAFSELASRMMGRDIEACHDWDDHPVIQAVRRERVDTALKLWGTGMPMDEVSDYLGMGLPAFPGSDVGYLPFSVSPVDSPTADPAADPALAEPAAPIADAPEVEQLRLVLLARQRAATAKATPACHAVKDAFSMFACSCHGGAGVERKGTAKQLAQWRDHMTKRRATVRQYESKIGRELMKARAEVLAKIERGYRPAAKGAAGVVTRAAAADFLFDLAKFSDGFLGVMRKQGEAALNTAGEQLFKELGRDDAFTFPPEEVLHYVRARENKLANVPQETFDRIKEALEGGINAGDTTEELARRIRAEFNGIDQGKARTIAVTETAAAYGQGRDEAMKTAGIAYKQWLTSGNDNVRAAHAAANDQIVGIDEFFDVGGEQLQFPGDPAGSPENVINCHCVSIPVESAEG